MSYSIFKITANLAELSHVFFCFFTVSSLQVSQQGTKTQGITTEEEKRRTEAKERDTRTS